PTLHPTCSEIYDVAATVTHIFRGHGLRSCLFGSTACSLFGGSRTPKDVDIVVFTVEHDQEALKQLLVDTNPDFYLVPSRNPAASYRVLWYALPPSLPARAKDGGRRCKVDIVLPGIMNIPTVPARSVKTIRALPVMPLIPLLLLKLQGWADHRAAVREDMWKKQYVDVRDIEELLSLAVVRVQRLGMPGLEWVPEQMGVDAVARAADFVEVYPHTGRDWQEVGLLQGWTSDEEGEWQD
ncbi:hypothetical protein C8Q76DRAFT_577346, partial [Earliella scabrosa]